MSTTAEFVPRSTRRQRCDLPSAVYADRMLHVRLITPIAGVALAMADVGDR